MPGINGFKLYSYVASRKHAYIILTPLKPHFYIHVVKLGYVLFFLFLLKSIDCGYSLEPPRRGGSNEYSQYMSSSRNMKNIRIFLSENFQFLVVKFLVYLNRHIFIMVMHILVVWRSGYMLIFKSLSSIMRMSAVHVQTNMYRPIRRTGHSLFACTLA